MIRLATYHDIPWIVEQMRALKGQTAWALVQGDWSYETLTQFVTTRLSASRSVCYVWERGDTVCAFCGGQLDRFYLPPHFPLMFEWASGGEAKGVIECWLACKAWAKRQGAQWAGRVKAKPGISTTTVIEHMVWKAI